MVTGNYGVKLATRGSQENRVRGERSSHVDIVNTTTGLNSRNYFRSLLNSKESAFGAVGIQSCDRQTRSLNTPSLQFAVGEVNDFYNQISFHHSDCF